MDQKQIEYIRANNVFRKMNRRTLIIMKKALEERRDKQLQKLKQSATSNRIDFISQINEILGSIQEMLDVGVPKGQKESIDNYNIIPLDTLRFIQTNMYAVKETLQKLLEKDMTEKESNDIRHRIHIINPVIQMLNGASNNHKRNLNIRKHVGETAYASDGKTVVKIVFWKTENNISIEFPDGRVLEHQRYQKFKKGKIDTPVDYAKKKNSESVM